MSTTKIVNLFIIGLFLSQSYLILSTKINVWPEMYFFPWLVSKGLLPYRDFFDHHGFLLYLILSPLSSNLLSYKVIYFLIRSLNLALYLILLRKNTSKFGFYIGGIIYVLISYFFSENNLWYETFITTTYLLLSYILLYTKYKSKHYLLGLLITMSSFIKPTAMIVLFPIFLLTKDIKVILIPTFFWLLMFAYFIFNHSFNQFIHIFTYNNYILKSYRFNYITDIKIILVTISLGILALCLIFYEKRFNKAIFCFLLFSLSSVIFLTLGYGRAHLLPTITFLFLIIGSSMNDRLKLISKLFIIITLIYSVFLYQKVKFHHIYLKNTRIPWIEDKGVKYVINYLSNKSILDKSVYIYGNHPEIYIRLNILPPTYFPIKFPLTELYFPDYQSRIVSELKINNVRFVIINKPIIEYQKLDLILRYIQGNYKLIDDREEVSIYEKK